MTFREECPENASENIILVGNKVDKVEQRVVSIHEGEELCKELGCIAYYETSAQSNINVDEVFFAVAAGAFQCENQQLKENIDSQNVSQLGKDNPD